MNPIAMTLLLTGGFGLFAVTCARRWRLLFAGATRQPPRLTNLRERLVRVLSEGFLQSRLRQYTWAGWAHSLVFVGFIVLLARTLLLWGRGFDPGFDLWILGRTPGQHLTLGEFYNFLKDCCSALVLAAVAYFIVKRVVWRPKRLTLSAEALAILALIAALIIADGLYDGASLAVANPWDRHWHPFPDPLGSLVALGLGPLARPTVLGLARVGFWTHSVLVLVFLNLLPYSKHFHIVTALANLFLSPAKPAGKLEFIAESAEKLLEMADVPERDSLKPASAFGLSRVEDLTWKHRLDLYSCTECGRCSEHCPAFRTGKPLSPKQLTLDLRGALFENAKRLLASKSAGPQPPEPESQLVPHWINPETVWSCTTCRACEEQCPVGISYVDKIVHLRRDLVLLRGEVPASLQRCFEGMERNGNPWNLSKKDRSNWANGLCVRSLADVSSVNVLYWVGCAASYDARAQRVAKAFVALMQEAAVDFAILGDEETCTGDAARRAGNEYLFMLLATANVATLNRYHQEKRFSRIVTACPHCLTTLKNEYPDLGGKWPVLHHSEFILELVQSGRLRPNDAVGASFVFHDPCTLARYASDVVSARQLLRKVPGVQLREAEHNRQFTLCCGAGGARMWMDEGASPRMNVARGNEFLATGAERVVTACPFCTTMIGDAVAQAGSTQSAQVLDIAEVLAESCSARSAGAGRQMQPDR